MPHSDIHDLKHGYRSCGKGFCVNIYIENPYVERNVQRKKRNQLRRQNQNTGYWTRSCNLSLPTRYLPKVPKEYYNSNAHNTITPSSNGTYYMSIVSLVMGVDYK